MKFDGYYFLLIKIIVLCINIELNFLKKTYFAIFTNMTHYNNYYKNFISETLGYRSLDNVGLCPAVLYRSLVLVKSLS